MRTRVDELMDFILYSREMARMRSEIFEEQEASVIPLENNLRALLLRAREEKSRREGREFIMTSIEMAEFINRNVLRYQRIKKTV